ncbi:unnamed protein product [Absidia cylindrospora]
MNNIPNELISAIVKNADQHDLHALTLVNWQFYTVTNPLLWRSVQIRNEGQFTKLLQGRVQSRHDLLQYVRTLFIGYPLTDITLLLLIPLLSPLLEELTLADATHISDESFIALPRQCPHLRTLALTLAAITNKSLVSLAEHCRQLRRIDLDGCNSLHANLFVILSACPLEDMYVNLDHVDGMANNRSRRCIALALIIGFPLLTSLYLEEVDPYFPCYLLDTIVRYDDDSDGRFPLPPVWPNLTDFYLYGTRGVEDSHMIHFTKTHPHINNLALPDNDFSDDTLLAVVECLPGLTQLDLSASELTLRGVRGILKLCPLLLWFNLFDTPLERSDFPELEPIDSENGSVPLDYFEGNMLRKTGIEILRRAWSETNNDDNDNDNDNDNDSSSSNSSSSDSNNTIDSNDDNDRTNSNNNTIDRNG